MFILMQISCIIGAITILLLFLNPDVDRILKRDFPNMSLDKSRILVTLMIVALSISCLILPIFIKYVIIDKIFKI